MRIERNRYAYPRRWFGPRAIVVDDDGLTVEGWLGIRSATPWTRVCGVRHARHGQAEVELVGGRRLALPGTGERLEALIEAISSECTEAQAEARERAARPTEISSWLGISPFGSTDHDPNQTARWAGPAIALLGGGLAAMPPSHDAAKVLLVALAGVVVAVVGWADMLSKVTVDVRGVTSRSRLGSWTVRWAEVLEVHYHHTGKYHTGINISLVTREQTFIFGGPRSKFDRVAEAAERIAAANTAHFVGDDGGVPDTALSLARLGESHAERGLSRSVEP